jgi:hypothetical protein
MLHYRHDDDNDDDDSKRRARFDRGSWTDTRSHGVNMII